MAGEQPESLWVAMNYIWTGTTPPEVTSLLDAIQADGYKSLGVGPQPRGLRLAHYEIPARLAISMNPGPMTAGSVGSISVTARDAIGRTWAPYRGVVHFTSTDAHAILPADYRFTAADAGTHTFTVTFMTAGIQAVRARDTVSATITGRQGDIVVTP